MNIGESVARGKSLRALEREEVPFATTSKDVCFRSEDLDKVTNILLDIPDYGKYECTQQLSVQRDELFRELLDKHHISWSDSQGSTCIERSFGDAMQQVHTEFHLILPTVELVPPEMLPLSEAVTYPEWNHVFPFRSDKDAAALSNFLESRNIEHIRSRSMDKYIVAWLVLSDEDDAAVSEFMNKFLEAECAVDRPVWARMSPTIVRCMRAQTANTGPY